MPEIIWYCPLCQAEGVERSTVFCSNDGARVLPIAERGAEWIGKTLADRYRIVRFIDAGGAAEVYEAERLTNGKHVAVKLLHAAHAKDPKATDDFLREAQLVSLIAHPNIVGIEDFGTLPSAMHYMVMELLHGRPLSAELARGALPPLTALRYAMQACEGLAAAHARDVLHCDIKPANLFLHEADGEPEPVVKVLDLGIGRLFAGGLDRGAVAAVISGTPDYMSPEQARGEQLGPLSDVYSMGVAVYEMLLGVVPFSGESPQKVLEQHVLAPPPWPEKLAAARGVPEGAREVVLRALEKEPAARQASMLDLQRELASIARGLRARGGEPGHRSSPSSTSPGAHRSSGSAAELDRPTPSTLGRRATTSSAAPVAHAQTSVRPVPLASATGADDEVVELARDVYWVGRRRGQLLECNAYLLVFRGMGAEMSLLIDPGPPEDFAIISAKVASIIGSIRHLDYVFLNHQDPDVASNAASIQQAARHTRVICSEDTFRLARFYGLDARRFSAVESFAGGVFTLPTGRSVVFVPTPFCHFRGATMVFDPASRVLFSGDLFGGARSSDMIASERSWPGVEMFHQIYMPSRRALALAAARVRRLDPRPTIIAPQHGAIIVGDDTTAVVDAVAGLDVGLDLLESPARDENFVAAANDLAREYVELAGPERARELLASFSTDSSFTRLLVLDDAGDVAAFKVAPRLALEALANDALATLSAEHRGDLRRSIQVIFQQHQVEGADKSGASWRAVSARPKSR